MIQSIELKNFKSFKKEKIEFRNQNIIIGNNASGKSNLIEAFRLVKDAFDYGLDNAYYIHGGFNSIYHRSGQISKKDADEAVTVISVEYAPGEYDDFNGIMGYSPDDYRVSIKSILLKLTFSRKGNYESQWYDLKVNYEVKNSKNGKRFEYYLLAHSLSSEKEKMQLSFPEDAPKHFMSRIEDKLSDGFLNNFLNKEQYSLRFTPYLVAYFSDYGGQVDNLNDSIRFYDFDSRSIKSSTKLAGEELKEDGSNFAFVLRDILKKSTKKKPFLNIVNRLLPTLAAFKTQVNSDGQLSIKYREAYSQKFLSGYSMSDGTAYMLALVSALVTTPSGRTLFFEEPDRYLHPGLSRQLVSIFEETSRYQLIITTHNQEFLRHVDPNSVKIIRKRKNGDSEVINIVDDSEIRGYLKKGAPLDELFTNNIIT